MFGTIRAPFLDLLHFLDSPFRSVTSLSVNVFIRCTVYSVYLRERLCIFSIKLYMSFISFMKSMMTKPQISDILIYILKAITDLLLVTELSHHKIYRLFPADPTASKFVDKSGQDFQRSP